MLSNPLDDLRRPRVVSRSTDKAASDKRRSRLGFDAHLRHYVIDGMPSRMRVTAAKTAGWNSITG